MFLVHAFEALDAFEIGCFAPVSARIFDEVLAEGLLLGIALSRVECFVLNNRFEPFDLFELFAGFADAAPIGDQVHVRHAAF